jgi:hypothetical protein
MEIPSSILSGRLAWTEATRPPSLEELGLVGLQQAAFDWQYQRSASEGNELALFLARSDRSDWVPEIHGLFGVGGELILTVIEAQAEVALLRGALGSDRSLPVEAALWRSMRFFLEAQANTVVVFGHTAANLTARTLALDSGFDIVRLDKPNRPFAPGAMHASAWFSLDGDLLKLLRSAAVGASPAGSALVHTLSDLLNGPWGDLNDLRKIQYHRWRGESPGVTGVNWASESMRTTIARGEGIELGGDPPYVEGHRVLEDLSSHVSLCVGHLAAWMDRFHEHWKAAFLAARPGPP